MKMAGARRLRSFVEIALRAFGTGGRAGQTAQPGAGEEAAWEVVLLAGAAEAGHGVVKLGSRGLESAPWPNRRNRALRPRAQP